MTTFMERLPSLRRRDRDPPSTDHRRLGSAPPSPESELAPEADLTELRHDDSPQKKKRRSSSKGKGKEVDPRERGAQSPFEVELDHQEFAGQEQDGMTTDAGGVSSYPPTNEEELETKRIEENLKRWELLEKQRRKSARESRSIRQPTTILGDVANYVAGSPAANGYAAPNRQSTGADSGRRMSAGGWTKAKTRDSQEEVELDHRQTSVLTPHAKRLMTASPPPIQGEKMDERSPGERLERPRFASPAHSDDSFETAQTHSTSRSDPRNPFTLDPAAAPEADMQSLQSTDSLATERGPQHDGASPRSSPALNSDNPFKNASAITSSPKADLDAPLLSSPNVLSPSTSPKPKSQSTLQVPRKTSRSKSPKVPKHSSTMPPPLVRPLDLPEAMMPKMEPNPSSGHFRRAQHDPQQQQEMEEEMEADREHGRWWTDWICGCREARRREDQDGRTNPFE